MPIKALIDSAMLPTRYALGICGGKGNMRRKETKTYTTSRSWTATNHAQFVRDFVIASFSFRKTGYHDLLKIQENKRTLKFYKKSLSGNIRSKKKSDEMPVFLRVIRKAQQARTPPSLAYI